jgi:hypothetical protein
VKVSDVIDLERLRVTPEQLAAMAAAKSASTKAKTKAKIWKRHWVRVPWTWVGELRKAKRISTSSVAHLLLYEFWRNGDGQPVVLSNMLAAEIGLGRQAKWRGLRELEALGLVEVEAHNGRSPRVSLKQV